MSLAPDLGIGLWNGWILAVIFLVANYSIMLAAPRENVKEMMDQVKHAEGKDKKLNLWSMILYAAIMVCTVFLPLKPGGFWLYTGLGLFMVGMSFTVPEVQLFFRKKGQLVTRGFYHVSRHPIYLMAYIAYIGIAVATASWLLFALIIPSLIVVHYVMLAEERICLEKYGDAYRQYMERTPMYIGIPKSRND